MDLLTSSLFSPCFWTSDAVHPEFQSTPQTSTLQAGGEWGSDMGGGRPGTNIISPLPLTLWVFGYSFQPSQLPAPQFDVRLDSQPTHSLL